MQDYVADYVMLIWQLVDDVAVDDVDILHVKRMTYSIFTWIHTLIPIQAKDNQTLNNNIIALLWWSHDTNNKKCLNIYKKIEHRIINKIKYIILAQRVVVIHNVAH
jgi:hypothetical protein